MTREELMAAVVDEARAYLKKYFGGYHANPADLRAALSALDAHTPEPEVSIRDVALQAIEDKLASVPKPRSYDMAHYCMGLEDAAMAIRAKIILRIPEIPATVERKP
jgi:hypothetical protein